MLEIQVMQVNFHQYNLRTEMHEKKLNTREKTQRIYSTKVKLSIFKNM